MASVSIGSVPSESQWLAFQARYVAAQVAATEYRSALKRQYRESYFAPAGKRARLEALDARQSKTEEVIYAWLYEHSPRRWSAGVPLHFVCSRLSFSDALTAGRLSVTPPLAYGGTPGAMAEFVSHA
ncbi:MAG TPA: hypothetical protein VKV73_26300 [Chloroflexota bacterium]|nr:hypothetical protein [Chloroflexota bacterium]